MPLPTFTTNTDERAFAGVCAGIARALGVAERGVVGIVLVAGGLALAWQRGGGFRPDAPLSVGGLLIAGVGAVILFGEGSAPTRVLAPGAVAGALLLIAGPWLWRLALERDAERAARIRTEERADVATRVHDSVLQTLALIQRHAEEPRRVASLARRQERELRGWLYADQPVGDDTSSLLAALSAAGVDEIDVYAEVSDEEIAVFVRDRGVGFDLAAIPEGRHGVRDSIYGRLERAGATAIVTSTPGGGTEVELRMPR